jgi:predicted transcriptional regulator
MQKLKKAESSSKNTFTLRLSGDERQRLERVAESCSKSYPDIMGETIAQWLAKRRLFLDT